MHVLIPSSSLVALSEEGYTRLAAAPAADRHQASQAKMKFAKILETLCDFLDRHGLRYSLAGAFALAAHGSSRATQDLDLLVDARGQDLLVTFLESLGYETLYRSAGFSNHVHSLAPMGRVDIIYLTEPTATTIFSNSAERTLLGRTVHVPRPEHLAALKIAAMRNDPDRTFQEMSDIQFILGLPGIDAEEIHGYFRQHGLAERYDEIRRLIDGTRR